MSDALAFVAAPKPGRGLPVVVIHSWWGLNQSFRNYALRLAEAGFLAGCVDLYDGRVAATEAEARACRAAPRREPMYRKIIRGISQIAADPRAAAPRVGLIGFSMGGHWAVWMTQRPQAPVAATVLYYAARSADFSLTSGPVLAHFAETDPFVTASARRSMERALARAGRRYGAHDYGGTGHWFAESADNAYAPVAADLALDRTIAFLRASLA